MKRREFFKLMLFSLMAGMLKGLIKHAAVEKTMLITTNFSGPRLWLNGREIPPNEWVMITTNEVGNVLTITNKVSEI